MLQPINEVSLTVQNHLRNTHKSNDQSVENGVYGNQPSTIPANQKKVVMGGAKGKLILKEQLRKRNPSNKVTVQTKNQNTVSPVPRNKLSMIE